MAYKTAHFKTAYLQREIVLDTKVKEKLIVGALCKTGESGLEGVSTIEEAEYLVAQSDMTLEKGHVPVELRDYRYSPDVAASAVAEKKVAVFQLYDKNDVVLDITE